jgi:hypothetical protein
LRNVLIGHTGFVGGNLKTQYDFDLLVNRQNLDALSNLHAEKIICAGLPAAKWLANKDPQADNDNMQRLCDALSKTKADKFILISTVDVYPVMQNLDESYDCSTAQNHAYGTNRLKFEEFIKTNFKNHNILRLPALFGHGLKKNIIYDLLNDNCLEMINPNSSFQWYPLTRLKNDIETAEKNNLKLVNLFTEPVPTKTIIDKFFKGKAIGEKAGPEAHYNLHTKYASYFGGGGDYIMSAEQVLGELGKYISSGNL